MLRMMNTSLRIIQFICSHSCISRIFLNCYCWQKLFLVNKNLNTCTWMPSFLLVCLNIFTEMSRFLSPSIFSLISYEYSQDMEIIFLWNHFPFIFLGKSFYQMSDYLSRNFSLLQCKAHCIMLFDFLRMLTCFDWFSFSEFSDILKNGKCLALWRNCICTCTDVR